MLSALGLMLAVTTADLGEGPRFGPTGALYVGIGGGDAEATGVVGTRGGVRVAFNANDTSDGTIAVAASTIGYERCVRTQSGGYHLLSLALRGELAKAMGNSGAVWVDFSLYVHFSGLLALDDDLRPGSGGGMRAGIGFHTLAKGPWMFELSWQRLWLNSVVSSTAVVLLGLGF